MDQRAREDKLIEFRRKYINFMFVTDLAARGIDIPYLENVIHFDFPTKLKLFIHRAGRTARAGRSGVSYGIVTQEELAYLHDLSIFWKIFEFQNQFRDSVFFRVFGLFCVGLFFGKYSNQFIL